MVPACLDEALYRMPVAGAGATRAGYGNDMARNGLRCLLWILSSV